MRSKWQTSLVALACGAMLLGSASYATAAEPVAGAPQSKILVAKNLRATKINGLNVRNSQGEKLGTVDDLVIDLETGKVVYAALSYGGILGLGDKLFAIPYSAMKFDHGKDEKFFVINMTVDELKAAPGFDKNNWPNVADPNWHEQIDKYYRAAEQRRTTTTTTTTSEKENNR